MSKVKYSRELIDMVLKDFEETGDIQAVSEKYQVPRHAIYRFRREKQFAPEVNKDKKIKQLAKELKSKDLEIRILRELLKKTYQVMPIDSGLPRST